MKPLVLVNDHSTGGLAFRIPEGHPLRNRVLGDVLNVGHGFTVTVERAHGPWTVRLPPEAVSDRDTLQTAIDQAAKPDRA